MYAVCGFFYYHMTKLKASSQTYPRFTIILLFGLTTLYLIQMLVAAKKYGVESGVDEVFKDFQPAQFFVCLIATILYLVAIYFFGFYIPTVVFMAAVLLYLSAFLPKRRTLTWYKGIFFILLYAVYIYYSVIVYLVQTMRLAVSALKRSTSCSSVRGIRLP